MLTQREKELDEAIKETKFFCQMVIKGLMSVVNEETIIPEGSARNPRGFQEVDRK